MPKKESGFAGAAFARERRWSSKAGPAFFGLGPPTTSGFAAYTELPSRMSHDGTGQLRLRKETGAERHILVRPLNYDLFTLGATASENIVDRSDYGRATRHEGTTLSMFDCAVA